MVKKGKKKKENYRLLRRFLASVLFTIDIENRSFQRGTREIYEIEATNSLFERFLTDVELCTC